MQIETLKVFCDLVESASFSQAAIRNFITQSAVSQQVRALESRFDTALLVRDGRTVLTTEAGRILYEGFRDILQRFDRMDAQLKSVGHEMAGKVRVAAVYTIGLYELSKVVKSYLKTYPKVNLHLEYSRSNQVYEDCQRGAVDLGLVPYPKPRKGIQIITLPGDRLILACPQDHPFAKRSQIDLRRIDGENFVAFERDTPSRRALDQIFREHGIRVRIVMEFDNIETIKRSVEIGAGISIVPQMTVMREVQTGAIAQLQFKGQTFYRSLGVVVKHKKTLIPAAQKFIELLETSQA